MEKQGLFIVIEGSDGSGKATQFNLLKERLKATGYAVAEFDFPRYDQDSSYFVRQYLKGAYGPTGGISPYTASLFYALDRFEASRDIQQALQEGKIVLANRYTGSNMAHQGSKFNDPVEQRGFFVWEDNLEFELLKIPRPDLSFFLRVPVKLSRKLIEERAVKTGKELDGHEKDAAHLKKALATYDILCHLFPKDFKAIDCAKDGQLLGVTEISNLIWEELKPMLPAEKPNPARGTVISLETQANKPGLPETDTEEDQLVFSFRDVSLLLRLQVERTRNVEVLAKEQDWSAINYGFYTPPYLPRELVKTYKATLQNITSLYEALKGQLPKTSEAGSILANTTPLSALSIFSARIRKTNIKAVCSELLAQDTDEAQWASKQLYIAARQKWPQDFKQPLESKSGPESINNIIAKLATERLPLHNSDIEAIKLLEARPRQEFALLAETIYPFTNLPLEEIADEISNWPYQQKYQALRQALKAPGLLKKVSYKLDVITDQTILGQIAEAASLKSVQVQSLTPRYGYEVPRVVEEAGLDDLYHECFDSSLRLYSLVQASDREEMAPYATLMGHKVRWQLATDAQGLLEVFNRHSKSESYKDVAQALREKVSEVHPLLWEIAGQEETAAESRKPGKGRVKASRQQSNQRRG